jgi:hypothetical protein
MSFGAGLAGFANGLNSGLSTGQRLSQMVEEDKLAKVRAQGIAEAQAMQQAATPKVQDLGDQQNLTSNPQMSRDPNADTSVNTSLQQFQNNAQAQADGGPGSSPVAAPSVQDTNQLSDQPLASAAPGAKIADPQASPAFANGLPDVPRKRFNVDGQGFDTQDQADAAAKSKAPPLSDFYAKALVPRMKDALLAQGKVEEAERWEKFATDEKGRKYGETWLNAVKLANQQDYDGAASELMKLHPHFADGYDLVSAEAAKGPDGSSGFNMRVRGPDGTVKDMFQNSRTLVEMGAPQLSPINAFQMMEKRQTAVDTLAAKEAIDERNDKRTRDRMMDVTTQRGKDAQAKQDAEDKAREARAKAAQEARLAQAREGWTAAAKRDADRIASLGAYRKAVSPEERQAIVVSGLTKDPMFNMLSAEDKKQRVADTMALIPQPQPQQRGQTVQNPVSANPQQQGIPQAAGPAAPSVPSVAPPGKRAVQVYDPATNGVKTIYR